MSLWCVWPRRRRLLLPLLSVATCGALLMLATLPPPADRPALSLEEQLESARWRDDAAVDAGLPQVAPLRRARDAARTQPSERCTRRLEVGIIFTKADQNRRMLPNLVRLLQTVAAHTSACVRFHMFTDDVSRPVIAQAFDSAGAPDRFGVTHHAIAPMADEMRPLIEMMQRHFAPRAGTYYNDVLFFLTTTMHRSLPRQRRIIMLDIDISVRADLAQLEQHFSRFGSHHVMGLSLELSPVYRHVLEQYRDAHPNTTAGGAPPPGFPGLNSGVVLLDLERMRRSERYNALITPPEMERRVERYSFKGHLGDQDLYTLLALDDRQLFYTLPCGWNRQLCQFWRQQLPEVFDDYYRCHGDVYILHGNCKSSIPTEGEVRA